MIGLEGNSKNPFSLLDADIQEGEGVF